MRASAAAASRSSSPRALGEPRVEPGEPLPGGARLLDDPVVLPGGAAEPVERRQGFVERPGAEHDRERIVPRLW